MPLLPFRIGMRTLYNARALVLGSSMWRGLSRPDNRI